MKYVVAIAAASAVLLSNAVLAQDAPKSDPAAADPIILKVDGEDVHKSEVEDAWKIIFQGRETPPFNSVDEKVKDRFLREIASEHVLYKEALKEGIDNSADVKATMEKIRRQVIIQQLLKEKTDKAVTDDKLKAAYDAHLNASKDSNQEELKARHILVKTKDEAIAIEKKLKGGEDFAKLAKKESQDKASGAAGGELGWFTEDKMLPEFSTAAAALKKNEISQPVKTDFGWHIIQLEDRRKVAPPSFDTVKDTLKQEVTSQEMGAYVNSAMANAKITEIEPDGKEKPLPPEALAPAAGKGDVTE